MIAGRRAASQSGAAIKALSEIDGALADPQTYADPDKATALGQRQSTLRTELEQAEGELLALYDVA